MNIINDTYKTVYGINLPVRIYFPNDSKEAKDLIISIHGGGWRARKTNDEWNGDWMNYQAEYYAKKGCISAVFSYRSIDITDNTNVMDLYRDCVEAVKYIVQRSKFKRMIIMGDSAGAHLAVMLAFNKEIDTDIVVACNPVLDLTTKMWEYTAKDANIRKQASPYYNISPTNTKFLFMHGDIDPVVDHEITKEYSALLEKAGISSKYVELPNVSHAFILKGYTSTDEQLNSYMKIIDDFLNE